MSQVVTGAQVERVSGGWSGGYVSQAVQTWKLLTLLMLTGCEFFDFCPLLPQQNQ